jgi:hypothetical protein
LYCHGWGSSNIYKHEARTLTGTPVNPKTLIWYQSYPLPRPSRRSGKPSRSLDQKPKILHDLLIGNHPKTSPRSLIGNPKSCLTIYGLENIKPKTPTTISDRNLHLNGVIVVHRPSSCRCPGSPSVPEAHTGEFSVLEDPRASDPSRCPGA